MKKYFSLFSISLMLLIALSCKKDAEDPNSIGGDWNVGYTDVNDSFTPTLTLEGGPTSVKKLKSEAKVVENKNGIVTLKGAFTFDSSWTRAMDT